MTELHIPRESIEALYTAADRIEFDQYDESSVDTIARPVLIAYLRDLLGDYPATFEGVGAAVLRRKLDELEAGR